MRYIDREGNLRGKDTFQDKFISKLYGTAPLRMLLKPMVSPAFSKLGGKFMDSRISKCLINGTVKRNNIDLSQYTQNDFESYNDFFTRRKRAENIKTDYDKNVLIAPCDGKLTVADIDEEASFYIKNTFYTMESLVENAYISEKFAGGTALIFRLTVDDYHRYIYMDDGFKSDNIRINGVFHTVNPVANDYYPVYKENTREYSMLFSDNFGGMLVMEVGAMLVGKIINRHGEGRVYRGEEKGNFAFGGSTIIVFLERGKVKIDEDISENNNNGFETSVKIGERIGYKLSGK